MIVDAANHLAGDDRRLGAVFLFQSERVQNRLPCPANFRLRFGVDLQHAELPLDDLHAGHRPCCS